MTVGQQMREILEVHKGLSGRAADKICIEWLEKVRDYERTTLSQRNIEPATA